jgi:predicted nucleotidyltransferase component of viral defense system
MITKTEIKDRVKEWGLREDIIEKDYVLSWLLFGIGKNDRLKEKWVFKGGTCLKKCYFETYRFSEDLDFTVIEGGQETGKDLRPILIEIADWIYETSGVEIITNDIIYDEYLNSRNNPSLQVKIPYVGPRQMRGSLPKIKLDITSDEILAAKTEFKEISHPYPDNPEEKNTIQAYSYPEVFAEKIRAFAQRLRPRDLYDIILLFRNQNERTTPTIIRAILKKKCEFVNLAFPSFKDLEKSPLRAELISEWENMLSHQLPSLPPIESFWDSLPLLFDWLEQKRPSKPLPAMRSISSGHETVSLPQTLTLWRYSAPLEELRFAALNRLLIEMVYQKANGQINKYKIEPYSLRRTKDGNILLYAVKTNTKATRAFRIDRIRKIEILNESFEPRWRIEFSSSGRISTPTLARKENDGFFRSIYKNSSKSKYTIQCPLCGKRFKRSKYSTKLNPHKDKDGFPCYGRVGFVVENRF